MFCIAEKKIVYAFFVCVKQKHFSLYCDRGVSVFDGRRYNNECP